MAAGELPEEEISCSFRIEVMMRSGKRCAFNGYYVSRKYLISSCFGNKCFF